MNNAFLYCLAYAASRNAVGLIAYLAEPNHYHAVVVDTEGRLPLFLECFHKLLAKCGNVIRKRRENFWSNQQTSVVELVDREDVVAKVAYTLGNPVKDHLVEHAHHWPGPTSLAATLYGKRVVARRPRRFFRKEGGMPETITLECVPPPNLAVLELRNFREAVSSALEEMQTAAAAERARTRMRLMGRKAVLAQDPSARPSSKDDFGGLNPQVAAKSYWARAEALLKLKAFRAAYRAAREAWLAGKASIFPPGTWWLPRFAAVPCEKVTSGW